ncbi:hypothetical protein C5F47_05700 [Nitrosopumilus cobalaminigenes]|uniref:Uncharacterized protein n=1 Tax=Nitrosopumilus cobalaminigenes TaxID=1470066 RepID=A0A7D5QXP2_9ARCH|nr:DUF6775 family putative metallopeptidase [Nitrosopumilus cobalaminigenes]QLH03076.1 hypothetical protein C5F47_05700 [Nitrosopumilus cobalaminigenes]
MKISKIILYDEPTVPEIQLKRLEKYISDTFSVKTETRSNFFQNSNQNMYEKIAGTRIFDLKKPFKTHVPSTDEIQIETQNLDMSNKKEMTLYDGFEFQKITSEFISTDENNQNTLHVIFTNKLTCTFDENDFRYHARALIGSNPTIISTTGIIEAPAKPKQYYLDLMTDFTKEKIDEIKEKYKGEFLEYNDSRTSEIIEGYVLQAIMYYETGEGFCENKECRLYNAHWQKDLFYSQLENKKLCSKHQEEFKKLTNQV